LLLPTVPAAFKPYSKMRRVTSSSEDLFGLIMAFIASVAFYFSSAPASFIAPMNPATFE
jgi:hypothetical protein